MSADRISLEDRSEPDEGSVCPQCGHSEIDTFWDNCPFPYGAGSDRVELDVRLPVWKCRKCGFQFFDEEAEDLRHEAVCRHLGVMSPTEIKALRRKYGLSRVDLARLTGLGEATIARWERGELIQNIANDRYLRVLAANPDNVRILKDLQMPHDPPSNRGIFRRVPLEERSRSRGFMLHLQLDVVGNN